MVLRYAAGRDRSPTPLWDVTTEAGVAEFGVPDRSAHSLLWEGLGTSVRVFGRGPSAKAVLLVYDNVGAHKHLG
jgi:hypothetical protein